MTTTMAATSAAQTATTFIPSSSSHENGYSWNSSSIDNSEQNATQSGKAPEAYESRNGYSKSPLLSQNGSSSAFNSSNGHATLARGDSAGEPYLHTKTSGMLSRSSTDPMVSENFKESDSLPDGPTDQIRGNKSGTAAESTKPPGAGLYGADPDDVSSKWIHRDKLARIESEELQAAGIVLPKTRARSRPRGDTGMDKSNGYRRATDGESQTRSRKNSAAIPEPKTPEIRVPSWDLRLPEEAATESETYFVSNSAIKGASRIPVAKQSPAPIPIDHLARETVTPWKRDSSPGADDSINYSKKRIRSDSTSVKALDSGSVGSTAQAGKRSASESSPKKNTTGRKASIAGKAGSGGRPKTRKDSTSSSGGQTRPNTRSGELAAASTAKQPEGEPPWMVSAYRPDPRLPPDQQLLPTVARRLQQEKWEREGKFGNVYDKEFRPLNDDGFLQPPEPVEKSPEKEAEKADEWPLKHHGGQRTGSYSTIPKIQEKPIIGPMPSPKLPPPPSPEPPVRARFDPEEEEKKQQGCGCCIVM